MEGVKKMDKVVVYGLGKRYNEYRQFINSEYHIIGISDKNNNFGFNKSEKNNDVEFIPVKQLNEYIKKRGGMC